MSETIAEIKITIKDDQVVWDTGSLDVPNMIFWLEYVKTLMLAQVHGEENIVRSVNH